MQNNVRIDLSERQQSFLIDVLQGLYQAETDLFKASMLKNLLQDLGVEVDDWTPSLDYYDKGTELDKLPKRGNMKEIK